MTSLPPFINRLPPFLRPSFCFGYHAYMALGDIPFLFKHCLHPWRTLFLLYFPIPWRLRNPPPLSVSELVQAPEDLIYKRHDNLIYLRNFTLFRLRDTRTRSLYRLYDALCTQHHVEIVHESTYIWHRLEWSIEDWPDPLDPDPVRYAVLAGIMEGIVDSFNWRLNMGICRDMAKFVRKTRAERIARVPEPFVSAPSWVASVPPSPERVVLFKGRVGDTRPYFEKRNVYGSTGSLAWIWYVFSGAQVVLLTKALDSSNSPLPCY